MIEDRGGSGQFSSGVSAQIDETALIVVKAEFDDAGLDQFTMYVNPTPGQPEPATGTVKNDTDMSNVIGLTLYSTGAMGIDEIRLGDTFEDVTPVPEPSAVVLFIGSAFALYAARRKF